MELAHAEALEAGDALAPAALLAGHLDAVARLGEGGGVRNDLREERGGKADVRHRGDQGHEVSRQARELSSAVGQRKNVDVLNPRAMRRAHHERPSEDALVTGPSVLHL